MPSMTEDIPRITVNLTYRIISNGYKHTKWSISSSLACSHNFAKINFPSRIRLISAHPTTD
jgi:hypothetical protein